jgi:hypothetical protein
MTNIRSAVVAGLLPLLGLAPAAGFGQGYVPAQQAPAAPMFSTGELDQMLAPVALYPDALLTQVLMAATYPIQVVEAERWLENPNNAALHGDMLVSVLTPLPWDPSVKSLVPFPQIVKMLNDQLDWTQSLGAAFANQQPEVMGRVQALRAQAEAAGTLTSTPQLRVVHEGPAVVIEPANPAVVYVPVYDPVHVYGPWAYAEYPPVFFPPAAGFFVGPVGIGIGIGFSVGFGVVGPLWGWGHPAWGGGGIVINNEFYSRISFNHATFAGGVWHHAGPVGFVGGFHPHPGVGFHGVAGRGGFDHGGPGRGGVDHGGPGRAGFDRGAPARGGLDRGGPARGGFDHGAAAGHGGPVHGDAGHGAPPHGAAPGGHAGAPHGAPPAHAAPNKGGSNKGERH